MKRFVIELMDVPYLAAPSVANLDVNLTALKIARYRQGHSNKTYDGVFQQVADMTTGMASVAALKAAFEGVKDPAWKAQLQDVSERLYGIFGRGVSRWYAADRKPRELFDRTWFKHAIRGVWVRERKATATLVNARKGLCFNPTDRAFLARGIYEFYLRDDPNIHDQLIVDLGAAPRTDARATRLYTSAEVEPMALEQFEAILKSFLRAVERAGFSTQPAAGQSIADLFRKK